MGDGHVGAGVDLSAQPSSLTCGQSLGIVETDGNPVWVKPDRSGGYRASKWASPDFVHTANQPETPFQSRPFVRVIGKVAAHDKVILRPISESIVARGGLGGTHAPFYQP